jgi:transposase
VAHVSKTEALGYEAVEGIYKRQATRQVEKRKTLFPREISIDEISLKKGHKHFVTVISAPREGCVVDVLRDRKKKTLEVWFDALPQAAREAIRVVCIDMCEMFREVAQAKVPGAEIVVDRFHVMKNLQDWIDKTRREIQREAEEYRRQELKGCRWIILKNEASLKEEEQERLAHLYEVSPELKRCHELKEEFRSLFNSKEDVEKAKQKLSQWEERVKESALEKLQKFLATLSNWREWIVNYFHERITNGFAEGLNNRIKLIKRRGFGYTNFEHFRLRILTECV